ncbi:helix-turn-helix transcriptional regulator [Kitasatospora purpeofusca]|uniref:helix-turn-helix transcriptional regulator n=1 Tax=Kitasatospora purpeofusca TaxID=67352 RepID=UPI0012FE89EA|nr:LuxR family transcriptional regulator [Kitasatospora purpeofusca]
MAAVVEGDWPVTAREAELAEIEEWASAGVGALLIGEPGVGKSTLLDAALERAERRGARVVRGAAVRDHLRGEARPPTAGRRLTIALDDVCLVDPLTLGLVGRMVDSGQALLLATAQAGSSLPNGLRRLLIGKRVRRLAVGALDRSGAVRMLAARLGGPVAVDSAERFWDLARGNALILRELAEQALAQGALRRVRGRWQWSGLPPVPDGRLVDLADLFLGDLDDAERELVRMLALAGPLEAGLPVVDALGEAAESLNRRGVLVAERSGLRLFLRLAHPFCAAVVAATLPELTARRLRQAVADAIGGTGARRPDDAVRVARLGLGAGALPGPEGLARAAVGALRAEDLRLAEQLGRAALAAGAGTSTGTGVAVTLGRALAGQGRHVEAEAVFAQAPPTAAVRRPRALNMGFGLGRLAEAEAVAGTDNGVRAVVRLLKDRTEEARQLAGTAVGAEPLLALLRHEAGDDEGALAVLAAARPTLAGRDEAAGAEHLYVTGWITTLTRGPDAAAAVLAELRELAADGGPRTGMYAGLLESAVLRATGRTAAAVESLRQVAAYRGTADWLTSRSLRLARLAGAVAESGDSLEASSLLEEARDAQQAECSYPLLADAVELEAALVAACSGDREAAADRALGVAARALAAGRFAQARSALLLAARAGAASRAVAVRQAPALQSRAADDVVLRYVRALAEGDGATLDKVCRRFEELGSLPLAAEAAAQAARAHRASGDRRRARAAQATCAELVSRCGAEPPVWAVPVDRQDPGVRTDLTTREREVVALAVSRLSNQEIAERLVLSVRTVENHLYRAYGKLGVTARTELAPALGTVPGRLRRSA